MCSLATDGSSGQQKAPYKDLAQASISEIRGDCNLEVRKTQSSVLGLRVRAGTPEHHTYLSDKPCTGAAVMGTSPVCRPP